GQNSCESCFSKTCPRLKGPRSCTPGNAVRSAPGPAPTGKHLWILRLSEIANLGDLQNTAIKSHVAKLAAKIVVGAKADAKGLLDADIVISNVECRTLGDLFAVDVEPQAAPRLDGRNVLPAARQLVVPGYRRASFVGE